MGSIPLAWVLLASSREAGAVAHFDVLTVYGALLGIGLALWAYHRNEVPHAVVRQASGRDEVSRLYDHLEAGVGLVASTVGAAMLLGIVLHKVMPAPEDWDRDVAEVLAITPVELQDTADSRLRVVELSRALTAGMLSRGVEHLARRGADAL